MTKRLKLEKRLHPRLNHNLGLKIAADGYNVSTTTQNVSSLGAYCHIERYIPPFTKILVKLSLPISSGGVSQNYDVECKGVIVRTEDSVPSGFNIAIFFNEINNSQRQKLSQYVNQFLPQPVTAL